MRRVQRRELCNRLARGGGGMKQCERCGKMSDDLLMEFVSLKTRFLMGLILCPECYKRVFDEELEE